MRNGEHTELEKKYNDQIEELREKLGQLELEKSLELFKLTKRCVAEHGNHLDDGGFMTGTCIRCGASLG